MELTTLRPSSNIEIVLTPHQNEALDSMMAWVNSNEPFHTLKGSAGVGKTTVLKEFCKRIKYKKLAVSAPTHKAKKVVANSTGLNAETIQGLLGLRPDTSIENFDPNKPTFDQIGESRIAQYRGGVVIIDEASMFNSELHDTICDEARQYNVKILFVGDELQLPPVNEFMSKALTVHGSSNLTEVIRQKNTNPLGIILSTLRNDILDDTDKFYDIINNMPVSLNDSGEGYQVLPQDEFGSQVVNYYNSNDFEQDPDYCKLVAWTNECVSGWNNHIRKSRVTVDEPLVPGDILLAYNSVTVQEGKSKELIPIITNSEDYKVTAAIPTETDWRIRGIAVNASRIDLNISTAFDVIHPADVAEFLLEYHRLLNIALDRRGRAWIEFYKFKNKHLLMQDIREGRKLIVKKDVDYGYAMTVHKTQGSTYKNVFVNLTNIRRNTDPVERRKLTYVAISRASHRCIILNA